jgi:protein tyrosine/serine phosphatase
VTSFTEDTSYGFYEIFPRYSLLLIGSQNFRYFQREIFQVFKILKDSKKPVLVHCNLGKDRTGCIVALFQEFLGFSSKDITNEYMASGRGCFIKNIQAFLDVITEYGGAEKYLNSIGFTTEELAHLKEQFSSTMYHTV